MQQSMSAFEGGLTAIEAGLTTITDSLTATQQGMSAFEGDLTAIEASLTAIEANLHAHLAHTPTIEKKSGRAILFTAQHAPLISCTSELQVMR